MPGSYQIVGSSGLAMLANRLSWFYDFTGPSMTVDTACSGGLLAVHLACQDLLSGFADMVSKLEAHRSLTWFFIDSPRPSPAGVISPLSPIPRRF
jgi:3-oxoacyl-(acyl-carrier-protein) synthase